MQPTTRVDSTLANTNLPFEPTADPTPPARTATPSGDRLVAITPIDVFGTAFELRSESTGDLLRTASRTRVWIILGAGAIAALAMYA